jgi:hypothetical protein
VPLVPHSDELGALARALARTTRVLANWFGLAHFAPTSDVHCRHPSTGAATPATASAAHAPHEAGQGVTRKPRAAAPSLGLGAKTCTPRTSATLPDPTTRIASVHQSSRELGPLHRIRTLRATPRRALNRASAPPKLHRQRFARSSYRCGIPLTGTCNSIFKDEHPSLHRLLRPRGQSELRTSRRSAHFGDRRLSPNRRFLPIRNLATVHL